MEHEPHARFTVVSQNDHENPVGRFFLWGGRVCFETVETAGCLQKGAPLVIGSDGRAGRSIRPCLPERRVFVRSGRGLGGEALSDAFD